MTTPKLTLVDNSAPFGCSPVTAEIRRRTLHGEVVTIDDIKALDGWTANTSMAINLTVIGNISNDTNTNTDNENPE